MANNIQIVISAVDKATAGIKGVGKELEGFAQRNRATFAKMGAIGAGVFAGITAGIKKTTDAYATQAKAEALVTRGFERVAETWKMTSQDLFDQASKLQKSSIFGDEEILQKVTNNLLTFGGVGEEVFNRAQKTALDLATTLEGDLQSSTIMLGKALENPVQGLSALSRVGIKFSEDQEEMIKKMAESGDVLGAQTLMLEEIEGLYGGAAQAAADALGPYNQLKKEMGDLSEVIGGALRPMLDSMVDSIRPVIENISKWISENEDLTKKIILGTTAIAGIIAVLGTLGLAIIPIIASIKSMTVVSVLLGKALMFLALNPIGMVITAIAAGIAIGIAIVKNWETIRGKAIELGQRFKKLGDIIYAVFFNAGAKISQFVRNAKEWGRNMIDMFVEGLKERYQKMKDGVLKIAQTIKNFLGFSSPTEEGPGSNSDKWIPNLINMMFDGFEAGKSIIQKGAERIAETIQQYISDFDISFIEQKLQTIQVEAMGMSASLQSSLTSQKNSIKGLVDEYRNLEEQIKAIDMNIGDVQRSGEMEIANRVLEIQKELAQIEEKKSKNIENEKADENELLQIKAEKLKAELEVAKLNTNESNIIEAQRLAERSKTDIILERMQAKIQEHEEEKERITELMELKKDEIESEYKAYKETVEQKKELDRAYFDLFQSRLQQQQKTIQETINMMRSLNAMSSGGGATSARALGGPVQGGRSYLVGERGPELFTPGSSGLINPNPTGGGTININMGGVLVQKEADENRLIEKMKIMLTREAKNFNIGIV